MKKNNFRDFQLSDELLKSIHMLNFSNPTKVQEQVIPRMLEGKDLIVKSQTGSGKTGAFAIPICQLTQWDENKVQSLVIVPTRELAIQVREDIFNIGRFKRLKVVAIYGRVPFNNQALELKQKTHVVVGTPGRILDHLERGTLDLSNVKHLVIDEADEMFKMGFIEQIDSIVTLLPKDIVTVVLSATMPEEVDSLCSRYLKDPVYVDIEDHSPTIDRIDQERYSVIDSEKCQLLRDLTVVENPDTCIIFCNTKLMVDEVYNELKNLKYPVEKIHGGMGQRDRIKVINNFKRGHFRYLVATDVAARGIDIENITLIINYEIPKEAESYVHRIGRTARKDNTGKAITFVSENEEKFLKDIEEYIGKEISLKDRPDEERVSLSSSEFTRKIRTPQDLIQGKDVRIRREIMKLHINAGKKAKMRAGDIVGAICNIKGITAEDIGVINIMEISTYVEILNNKGETVCRELQKTPIKGKLRKVSKANK